MLFLFEKRSAVSQAGLLTHYVARNDLELLTSLSVSTSQGLQLRVCTTMPVYTGLCASTPSTELHAQPCIIDMYRLTKKTATSIWRTGARVWPHSRCETKVLGQLMRIGLELSLLSGPVAGGELLRQFSGAR